MPNLTYNRAKDDTAYRKVNVNSELTPAFQPFGKEEWSVSYPDTVLLEIQQSDGNVHFAPHELPTLVGYKDNGKNAFWLPSNIPTERLWLRRRDGTGIWYKVPSGLPKGSYGEVSIPVPGGVQEWELAGDRYFEELYTL